MKALNELIHQWLTILTENQVLASKVSTAIVGLFIFISAYLLLILGRKLLTFLAHRFAKRTISKWDDILIHNKFFLALAHLAPASFLLYSADFAKEYYSSLEDIMLKLADVYFIFAGLFIIFSLLSSINEIYEKNFSFSKERPINGFIQLLKIFIGFLGFLLFISIVIEKDLSDLFKGLGAAAAILLLIFRDTILGFVASIQISMNDMVKKGDWIQMPSRGADGDVINISLHTVKVQNWDKTIAMIPTHALITESFMNWRGMEESGGRRIKRSVNIDINSVKFCSQDMLEKFKKFILIKDYVTLKQNEIEAFNDSLKINPEQHYNGRRQTNLGIFRKYLEAYLHNHPKINQEMTFLIRHLQPTDKGIPIEVYVFSNDQVWANYEAIQADIFDHILAIIPEFELRVFQAPSGFDISNALMQQNV